MKTEFWKIACDLSMELAIGIWYYIDNILSLNLIYFHRFIIKFILMHKKRVVCCILDSPIHSVHIVSDVLFF